MRQPLRIRVFVAEKRIFDTFITLLFSPLLIVVGLLVALLVYLTMGTPVIFTQRRLGFQERPFLLLKFRTMSNKRSRDGKLLPDSLRITSVGRFLRKTSLDELPQFINVLFADMAIIGPRPLLIEYRDHYTPREHLRHSVRPGITGLAQVSGRNDLSWEERLELDCVYASRASLVADLSILFSTVRSVLTHSNVVVVPSENGERLDVIRSYPVLDKFGMRRFERRDIPDRVRWFHDPRIATYMSLPAEITEESTLTWLDASRKDPNRRDFVIYSMVDKHVVAMLGVKIHGDTDLPELYIMVDPDRQHQGIGKVSLQMLLTWMKDSSTWRGCRLSVSLQNIPALTLYTEVGFQQTNQSEQDRIDMELIWA
jgi:lipopolysaccharide/colanic/teichoic acid biosynthesis glycosyltransferase/RimJ/RimL family protein N-acetyltransferase